MGITRVANVTGLDSIGISVVMVCRPNSRSVSVSQGKGINIASARASGLMEAAELYHAETSTISLRLASYEELCYRHNVVVDGLPGRIASRFQRNLRLLWCESRDLVSGESVLVPYELVHTNYTLPSPEGHGCFVASSNGLASGNELIEAISHGICEVVERDATTLWRLSNDRSDSNRLDLNTVDHAECRKILGLFERAGFDVAVWDITSDIKLPVFACLILPRAENSIWHRSIAMGYGCHPARGVALLRAMTEAAQVRLTLISGMRDDVRDESYERLLGEREIGAVQRRVRSSISTRRFQDVPNWERETFEEDLELELRFLNQADIRQVLVVDLTKPEFGLPVARVIIPGLEPSFRDHEAVGQRATAIMLARK
jgi:YcaO-like protein with predicted kinase domain